MPELTQWSQLIGNEKQKPYFKQLMATVKQQRLTQCIYPAHADVFNAFRLTPLTQLRVIILGQDPYHGANQAHGLSFSVRNGVPHPPSLKNIFKALEQDLGYPPPQSGDLSAWARQGVLLLNTVLTVQQGRAHSHAHLGWQTFTDHVIKQISLHCQHLVFLLWGSAAQKKIELIDQSKHCLLTSVHPSPLSAHRGFLTCKHFSRANDWLAKHDQPPIHWSLKNQIVES